MTDFSDRPFVAGSMTGIRSFNVDGFDRLTGVVRREVWKPGVNVGTCLKDDVSLSITIGGSFPLFSFSALEPSWRTAQEPEPEPEPVSLVKHRVGQMGCTCGYYAYFDTAANPHHKDGNLLGVIEGYGVTTVGSRGFRCEKARLVGVIDPGAQSWWKRTTWRFWIAPVIVLMNLAVIPTLIGDWLSFSIDAGAFVAYLASVAFTHKRSPLIRRASSLGRRVAALYDVPVYASVKDATASHPLTPPPPPTPETDADFWTRKAVSA